MRKYTVIGWAVSFLFAQKVARQTDWHGGPGVSGPVADWNIYFTSSTNINYLYEWGRISLAAEVFPDPIRHRIWTDHLLRTGVQTGDFNKDGFPDVAVNLVLSPGGVHVYMNPASPPFENWGSPKYLPCYWLDEGMNVVDLDLDGDADIIASADGGHHPNAVYFFENDGKANFSPKQEIGRLLSVDGTGWADIDNDGDIDVIASACDAWNSNFEWYANIDNNTFPFREYEIRPANYGGALNRIPAGDFNNDGWVDFVVIHGDGWRPFESYIDIWMSRGNPPHVTFTPHRIIYSPDRFFQTTYSWVIDLDKDGDLDLVVTEGGGVDWWENTTGNYPGEKPTDRHIIEQYGAPRDVVAIDIDIDGDHDIITAFRGRAKLGWYRNLGNENFHRREFPTGYSYRGESIWVDDIDQDGFKDLVSTAPLDRSVDWWDMIKGFISPGELISSIYDSKVPYARWGLMEYDADVSRPGTSVKFQVRASDDPTNMGAWKDIPVSHILDIYGRYFQYKAILETTNSDYTPHLYEVRFYYWGCDLGIDSILVPRDTVNPLDTIIPVILVENTLEVKSDEAYLRVGIDSAGTLIYADTVEIPQIPPKEDRRITMKKKWIVGRGDEDFVYKMKVYIDCDEDRDSDNDYYEKDVFRSSKVGVEEDFGKELKVFARDKVISIENTLSSKIDVFLYDISGRVIRSRTVNLGERVIFDNLPSGIYFLIAKTSGERSLLEKIVIY